MSMNEALIDDQDLKVEETFSFTLFQLEFDYFLEKIGYSRYQFAVSLCLGLGMLNEGSQIFLISLVNYQVSNDPKADSKASVIFGSAFFFGNLIGSLIAGFASDYFGRKLSLVAVLILMYSASCGQSFIDSSFIYGLAVLRGAYGVGMGCFTPISFTLLAETMPKNSRGMALAAHASAFTVGGIISGVIAIVLSTHLQLVPWKTLNLIGNQTVLLSFLILVFYLVESPRYTLLVKKDFELGKSNLISMGKKGSFHGGFNEDELNGLETWVNETWRNSEGKTMSILTLFSPKYLKITAITSSTLFSTLFTYYGLIYITPLVYSEDDHDEATATLLFPYLAEMVSGVISVFMIERKEFGRKRSLIYGALATGLGIFGCAFVLFFDVKSLFNVLILFSRLMANFTFIILDAFSSEVFETGIRTTGFAFAIAWGKLASAIMPSILEGLLGIGNSLPYFGLAGLMTAVTVISCFFPKETRGEALE